MTRDNPQTLLREHLILDELERARRRQYWEFTWSWVISSKSGDERRKLLLEIHKAYTKSMLPWQYDDGGVQDVTSSESLIQFYHNMMALKKRQIEAMRKNVE